MDGGSFPPESTGREAFHSSFMQKCPYKCFVTRLMLIFCLLNVYGCHATIFVSHMMDLLGLKADVIKIHFI